ncbi:Hemicentin-1 [Orchesella cincta]|uniref:Hemicentin-1 n=1 Tax=Orchesella cincta TaxID=48709 RepID=A0A1D2MYG9_ORCCI|nr:Hemicentin-1 [Orchesella cincta]
MKVSTGTGIVSYLVHLTVAVPEAFILGNGEYHVEQGSTINLVCVIEKSPKPPEYIFWYHNDRMINYGSSREVKVHNEPGSKTQSRLTIRDAQISDSGNYTCKTAHAEPASTLVYVSQDI